ncbi:hypothetical protein QOZ80_9AG0682250 [Eleusine coracana subsp. coracana]|nr:hypothetical protein QOZ80_9AG0682250 [Eleusine coracana subsp. coracana]
MSSKIVEWASVLVFMLVVSAFSVGASGGRELAHGKVNKEHSGAVSEQGATAPGDMVKTNDYGRYDPTPAFSKPRFKLIPN